MRKFRNVVLGLTIISVLFGIVPVFGATGSADYVVNDTYETGTTPTIPASGDFQASLTPSLGAVHIAEQSNAAVLTYHRGASSVTANSSRLALDTTWYNGKVQVYEMDMFIPKNTNITITLEDSWSNREGFMISNKGWIAPHYMLDFEGDDFDWWLNNSYSSASTSYPNEKKSDHIAEFSFGRWNKVTMISDIENKIYYLYLNDNLVGIMDSNAELSSEKDSLLATNGLTNGGDNCFMQIINRKAKNSLTTDDAMLDVPVILDNIKIGNMESFTKVDTLASDMAVNVQMFEDFEDDTYNLLLNKTNADGIYAWGGLKPNWGNIYVEKQSDAAIVSYGSQGDNVARDLRFNRGMIGLATDEWASNTTEVISFDIQMFKKGDLSVAFRNSSWGYLYDVIISKNGYITHANNKNQADIKEIYALDKATAAETYDVVDFAPYVWHNIKILFTASALTSVEGNNRMNVCRLYVDDNYVGEVQMNAWANFQYIDISNYSASVTGEATFAIDNLKIGTLNEGLFVEKYQIENEDGTKAETVTAGNTYNMALSADFNKKNDNLKFIVGFYSVDSEGKLTLSQASVSDMMTLYGGATIENDSIATFTVPENVDLVKVFAWNENFQPIFPVCEASVAK